MPEWRLLYGPYSKVQLHVRQWFQGQQLPDRSAPQATSKTLSVVLGGTGDRVHRGDFLQNGELDAHRWFSTG